MSAHRASNEPIEIDPTRPIGEVFGEILRSDAWIAFRIGSNVYEGFLVEDAPIIDSDVNITSGVRRDSKEESF